MRNGFSNSEFRSVIPSNATHFFSKTLGELLFDLLGLGLHDPVPKHGHLAHNLSITAVGDFNLLAAFF
jgi:hypothetical protein